MSLRFRMVTAALVAAAPANREAVLRNAAAPRV